MDRGVLGGMESRHIDPNSLDVPSFLEQAIREQGRHNREQGFFFGDTWSDSVSRVARARQLKKETIPNSENLKERSEGRIEGRDKKKNEKLSPGNTVYNEKNKEGRTPSKPEKEKELPARTWGKKRSDFIYLQKGGNLLPR